MQKIIIKGYGFFFRNKENFKQWFFKSEGVLYANALYRTPEQEERYEKNILFLFCQHDLFCQYDKSKWQTLSIWQDPLNDNLLILLIITFFKKWHGLCISIFKDKKK